MAWWQFWKSPIEQLQDRKKEIATRFLHLRESLQSGMEEQKARARAPNAPAHVKSEAHDEFIKAEKALAELTTHENAEMVEVDKKIHELTELERMRREKKAA